MPTVLRLSGYRFEVYLSDHEPPHVHVKGGGGEAKVMLDPVHPDWWRGLKRSQVAEVLWLVKQHQGYLLSEWERIVHGQA